MAALRKDVVRGRVLSLFLHCERGEFMYLSVNRRGWWPFFFRIWFLVGIMIMIIMMAADRQTRVL